MAGQLLKAGYDVKVWNRTREKADALAALGARVASEASAAVQDVDIVILMLENAAAVRSVLSAAGVSTCTSGTLFVDMGSNFPKFAQECEAALARHHLRHLDAPVSGGVTGAETASLAIMAGGAPEDFLRAHDVLCAMGRPTHVGPSGSGQLAKLCNQSIVAVTIGAVAEAMFLAQAGGADPAQVRAAISGGFADSRVLQQHGARMISRNFTPGGTARNQLKDLDAILELAAANSLRLPLTERVRDEFRALVNEHQAGELDHSALLLHIEDLNAHPRPEKIP
jgi:2-hydroxy-3-oxopropionate reductase